MSSPFLMDGQMQKNATDVKHDVKVAQGQTSTPCVNLTHWWKKEYIHT